MKKPVALLTIAVLGLIVSCQTTPKTDPPETLKNVLISYYNAMEARDFDQMKEISTADFIIYEDGKIWNNDSLIQLMNSMPESNIEFTLDNFSINIDQQTGHMYYSNHGDVYSNDTITTAFDWLESATFKKVDGTWKLDFLHSTVKK